MSEDHEIKVPCEVYSRIVGYMRPVGRWNDGKAQEFRDRVTFDVSRVIDEARADRREQEKA